MSWITDNPWVWDIVDAGVGLWEASDKKKNKVNMSELYKFANPNTNTPFYTTRTEYNNGKPEEFREFTPELQQIMDTQIFDRLNQQRNPYQMSEGMRGIADANIDWQRARYDLPKAEHGTAPYTPYGNSQTGEGTETDDPDPVYEEPDTTLPDNNEPVTGTQPDDPAGNAQRDFDAINRALQMNDQRLEGTRYANRHGSVMDWIKQKYGDTWNASELDKLLGEKDIGSLDGLNLSENAGAWGSVISALSGIPGLGFLGRRAGQQYRDDRNFFSPTNPDDPYAPDSDASREINDIMNPDNNLPNSPLGGGNTWSGDVYGGRSGYGGGGLNYNPHIRGRGNDYTSDEQFFPQNPDGRFKGSGQTGGQTGHGFMGGASRGAGTTAGNYRIGTAGLGGGEGASGLAELAAMLGLTK